jgi:hypothetical protein
MLSAFIADSCCFFLLQCGRMNSGPKPDRLELARLEKLEKIQSLGLDPWESF